MLRFSCFTLDAAGLELRRDGVRVDTQPLVLSLLAYMAARPGRLLTKEELAQAVWKGQEVSDEVIARAVMKARRALGEGAQSPRHLLTEPSKGYRFEPGDAVAQLLGPDVDPAAPDAPAAPALGWRVLPFVNRSENPGLDWTVTGLQRLLRHAMEAALPTVAVTAEEADRALGADLGPPSARVARALALQPHARWVACEIDEMPNGHRVALAWGTAGEAIDTLQVSGPSLPALVLEAATQLAPRAPWQQALLNSHPQAFAQLQETISHLGRWEPAEARRRLMRSFEKLPPHPQLQLQQAEMLLKLDAYDEAEAVSVDASRALEADPSSDLDARLQARLLLAEAPRLRGDLDEAEPRVSDGLAFVAAHDGHAFAGHLMVRLWTSAAALRREAGDFEASRQAFERAALHAARAGLVARELAVRVWMCQELYWLGQGYLAQDLLRQHLVRANELGERKVAVTAALVLGLVAAEKGNREENVRWCEQALARALPVEGDAAPSQNARNHLTGGLIALRQFDRAETMLHWRRRDADPGVIGQLGILSDEADLHWRQGRLVEAAACYERLFADRRIATWAKFATQLRSAFAILLCLLGRVDEARSVLAQAGVASLSVTTARAQAALAMAEGRREVAAALLDGQLDPSLSGQSHMANLLLDRAWLCLEAGDDGRAEELLARVAAMDRRHPVMRWIELALEDRVSQVPASEWAGQRQAHPSLVRHCPWLGTEDDVRDRREGKARTLPSLLTVLDW